MSPATILVVEDNPITRKLVRVALAGDGYTVLEAGDGRTALDLLARHVPDLVLQDLILPDVDGFDLIQELRARPEGAAVPVLAVSGFLSRVEQARSLAVGFTDYLFKPVEPAHLLATVRAYLRPAAPVGEKPGRGRQVLVADDDPVQLKLLKVQLEQWGFRVSTAANGADALEKARRSPPDAVVSDVLMPVMDGFRLCLAVRQDPRLARVPVLLISAVFTEEPDQELARNVGASGFVQRTPDHREAIEALLACLGRAPAPPPAPPPELPLEDYTHRVLRQLEHHVGLGATLTRRLALLEAELGILGRMVETLKSPAAAESVLGELLYRCLDAAGISRGAAYLLEPDGRLALRARLGYAEAAEGPLRDFFGRADLLRRVLDEGEPVEVNLAQSPVDGAADLLTRSGARSILLTPLLLGERRLGVLGMASADRELGEDWAAFAKGVGSQIAQALELARALGLLSASEQRYRDLVQSLDAVVWEAEAATGRFTFVSKRAEALLGYAVSAWLEAPDFWARLLHPDDREQALTLRHSAVAAGRDLTLEYRARAADGRVLWLQDTTGAPRGDGRLRGVLVDVTPRKEAAEALRRHESLLRAVTDGTTDAVFVKDLEGRYLLINPAGARLLGKTVAEVLGKHDGDLFAAESAARIVEGDRRVVAAGEVQTYEETVTAGGVTRTYLSTKGPYRDAQGDVLGLIGIARDITERVRANEHEAKLRFAREIQQGFFPAAPPRLAGIDVGGASYPAEATGGDYYDYFLLADGSLAVAIGDASGHGFGPALLMAETRAYLRALALTRCDLSEVLALLNGALAEENDETHFVTLLLARLDPATRTLTYGSAGHPTCYVLGPAGEVKASLRSSALPLGIAEGGEFPTSSPLALAPGDLVLLLTDGILEARARGGTFFGVGRALDLVRTRRGDTARAIVGHLHQAVRDFCHDAPQLDDVTAVVIKVESTP
jgi:PAS domain S-box-containing protein